MRRNATYGLRSTPTASSEPNKSENSRVKDSNNYDSAHKTFADTTELNFDIGVVLVGMFVLETNGGPCWCRGGPITSEFD
jgi:hypothetical protein